VVALLCGLMFWTSHDTSDAPELGPERYVDLASLVRRESREVERLQRQQRELAAEVGALTAKVEDRRVQEARERERRTRPEAGLAPVTGKAITVTLADAPAEVIESSDLDPNYFVVHQQHIQRVVNAMWAGGARAITSQGQRIVTTTGIKCEGNAIQLQGDAFPQPYVIRAIGDQDAMLDEIRDDPYLKNYRKLAKSKLIQLGWDVKRVAHATAPAYQGTLEASYAQPMS